MTTMNSVETVEIDNMPFVEVVYNPNGASSEPPPVPHGWQFFRHPNGDPYYYNPEWRVITPEMVCNSDTLGHLTDALDEYVQELQDDPASSQLPNDYEIVISDVSASAATFRMYSRSAGAAYTWTEETSLVRKSREDFWTFVSEYPSHHPEPPPDTEAEFALAISNAKVTVASGAVFPFSEAQIDQIFTRYSQLIGQRTEGQNITAQLAWLMGVTMPLDAVGRRVDDEVLAALMNGIHF